MKQARRHRPIAVLVCASVIGIQCLGVALASANAPAGSPAITATVMQNLDASGNVQSVTVNLSGQWVWAGQNCAGRYGEGWAVDWWGNSATATPSNSFSLSSASVVNKPGTTSLGTLVPSGSWQIKTAGGTPKSYFHVGQYYSGETINSAATCTDVTAKPSGSTGSWSATATYPNLADLPAQLCVNFYDEHGSRGKISNNANDFSSVKNNDNAIASNQFATSGSCVVTPSPMGY